MKNNSSLVYNFFLIIGDVLALVTAFGGAYILRVSLSDRPLAQQVSSETYITVFLALVPFWIITFGLLGLYNNNIYEKRFSELGRLLTGSFIGMMFVVFWNFLASVPILPAKLVPLYGFMLAFVFLVLFRNLARLMRTLLFAYGKGLTHVLIVGDTHIANELVENLINSSKSGYRILGLVSDTGEAKHNHPDLKVLNNFADATKRLKSQHIHSIIQTELHIDEAENQKILNYAQANHIGYRFIPGNSELFVGKLEVELFRSAVPVIAVHQTALLGWGRLAKRVLDIVVALVVLALVSPIILLISIINKFASGSVFFRQVRLTRFNQRFTVYKFRTQYKKYDGTTPEQAFAKMGKPELGKQYRDNGDFLEADPRITPFGRLLRKSSLDELPQLFNVLKGDLSLVGPRALIPEELGQYEKRHAILSVKSGITGLAQVSGRNNITFEERRQLDMFYVQNWSFWLDLTIIIKTIKAVVTGSGAT